jgi:hypothetical protein
MRFKGNFGELELLIEGKVANGKYQENGTLTGEYTDNIFKGIWHNKGLSGLIEFSIIDGKLDGKWKKGIEPGPLKSKWEGQIISDQSNIHQSKICVNSIENHQENQVHVERHGNLKWTNGEGVIFDGRWVRDIFVKGTIYFLNGDVYEGDVENEMPHGKGKLSYKDGAVYEGDFVDGLPTGCGKLIYYLSEIEERDLLLNDAAQIIFDKQMYYDCDETFDYLELIKTKLKLGHNRALRIFEQLELTGMDCFTNEIIYEGDFKNGIKHGFGKLSFANSDYYEGDFIDNKRTGKGKYFFKTGGIYEGDFFENKRHGHGLLNIRGNIYDIDFKDGVMGDYGKVTYSNGDFYEGELYDIYRHGKGKMIYHNGDVYVGNWNEGERDGKGEMKYSDGVVYKGNWLNDERLGLTELEKAIKQINEQREVEKKKQEKEEARLQRQEEKEQQKQEKEEARLQRQEEKEQAKTLKEAKKETNYQNKTQGCSYKITYEVKLKKEAGFFNTLSATKNAIKNGKGFLSAVSITSDKGGFRERSITVSHDKNSLSNSEAKNYISKNDQDIRKGVAGSSTINIISIKKWNGYNYK